MGTNQTMIEIDGEKLRAEIFKRGLTFANASKELGHANTYIGNVIARGLIPSHAAILLKSLYNIDLDSYKKPEIYHQESFIEKLQQQEPILDYDRLWKVIYTAVYEAIKKARTEE